MKAFFFFQTDLVNRNVSLNRKKVYCEETLHIRVITKCSYPVEFEIALNTVNYGDSQDIL